MIKFQVILKHLKHRWIILLIIIYEILIIHFKSKLRLLILFNFFKK
jgi:hypothetical protein